MAEKRSQEMAQRLGDMSVVEAIYLEIEEEKRKRGYNMVQNFANLILQQINLPKNKAKGGWEECDLFWLIERGIEEMKEIHLAIQDFTDNPTNENWNKVMAECGDAGAFAAMIADNVSRMEVQE